MSSFWSEADSASRVTTSRNMLVLSGSCSARHTWKDWLAYWWEEHPVAHCREGREGSRWGERGMMVSQGTTPDKAVTKLIWWFKVSGDEIEPAVASQSLFISQC